VWFPDRYTDPCVNINLDVNICLDGNIYMDMTIYMDVTIYSVFKYPFCLSYFFQTLIHATII
jgi:hypothetical protein